MTINFTVNTAEILLLDEAMFLNEGGEQLRFGHLDGNAVQLEATGSREAISCLAHRIIAHHTAAH
jgi:hypothetical protein